MKDCYYFPHRFLWPVFWLHLYPSPQTPGAKKEKLLAMIKQQHLLKKNKDELNKFLEKRVNIGKVMFANEYVYQIAIKSIGEIDYSCDRKIVDINPNKALPPDDFYNYLKNESKTIKESIESRPVRSYGIEIPQNTTISLAGIKITMNTVTAAQVMQVILMPLLIL